MAEIKPMIHKYCQNGTYMLLDVNSGIINVIDKMTYDVLDVYDGTNKDAVYEAFAGTYDKQDLDDILGELDELIKKELLFAPMTENRSSNPCASTSLTTATCAASTALPPKATTTRISGN